MNDGTARQEDEGGARRIWLLAAALVVVIAGIMAAAFLLSGDHDDADYPPGSPEAAFQGYVQAWESGDTETAWAALSAAAQERLPFDRFRSANRRQPDVVHRIWIDDVDRDTDKATLHLTVESLIDDGFLGRERERSTTRVLLVQEGTGWRIDNPTVSYYW